MAKYSNTVEYNIKTSLDSKGLTQLKSELQGLELKLQNMGNKGLLDEKTFSDARNQIQGLGQALTDAFNPSLGMLDLSKLNQELKNNDVTAQGLKTAFSQLGSEGQVAFNNLVGELGKLDTGILRTNSQIDKLFTTFSNTFRWGLVSSFFSNFMNSIHQSVDYVKELDDSLTQIMLVTDYNRDAMNQYAKSANEAAKAVSMTTTGMTNASLVFAQQGYNLNQSQELATLSAKLANASQQDTATTSDQITAYMNAYGLQNSMEELTQQMDNWALIANISAADVSELAQASQRAASMANTVGVSGEQLAAQIATIESVTREAPEQIGNGLKTLYARFSDISQGGEDEEGIKLGDVTQELNKIGVQVLDQFGNIRDIGDIMEDLMVVWDDLDQTSKIAAAQSLAGKYQVNRFVSLMDNSDMYREYKGATGSAATGTLDVMSEEYADSIAGRSAKLQASLEGLFSTIFNTDDIYPWMDAAQGAVDLLQQFFDALGGGKTVLLGISSLLMQVFSKNMAQEINNAVTNRAVQQQKLANLQNSEAALTTLGLANPNSNDANSQGIINFARYINNEALKGNFNADQMSQANAILEEMIQNSNAATMAANELKETLSVIGTAVTATTGESVLAPFLDSEGAVNATLLSETLQKMSQSEVAELFGNIQQDIQPAREGLLEFNKALQAYQQELRNTASSEATWTEKVQILEDALYNLQGKIDPDTYQRYVEAVSDIILVTDDAGNKTAETTAEVAKLAEGLEKVAGKDLTNLDQLNSAAFKAKNTQSAAADSRKVAGAFQEGIDSQGQIQGILNTLNAVQQLTFAWQAFQNLGSLWANEDLSTGEKVLQTIMNLTMAMPQLITAMDTLKTSDSLKNIGQNLLSSLDFSKNGQKSLFAKEQFDELIAAATKGREAMDAIKFAGRNMSDEIREGLEKTIAEGALAEDALTKIGPELLETSMVGTTGLEAIKASLAGLATSAKAFLAEFWPLLLIGAAVAGISALVGVAQEQAEQAHQEAISAFEDAKNAQQQVKDLSSQINDWQSKRNEQGNTKELAQDADALADSLRDLGNEEEAAAVHLAAIRAEANGTAASFNELENTLNAANQSMSDQSALDTMEAANAILKDRLSTTEELTAANETMQSAALDYNINQMSRTAGMDMGITGVNGDNDLRAATMDWQSLQTILDQSVPGFAEITDENEKLALALSHTSDEALRAAIQIEQLANANTNLTEGQQTSITQKLEGSGFSAQESLQLMASLDKNASYQEIVKQIEEVKQQVNAGTPFEVALQAKMDPEQLRESVQESLAAYEPKDEDVDSGDFQSLSNMFMNNSDRMGEEGTPFADYSEDLLNNAAALEEVVEGILRYDDAVQTIDSNLEDWQDALNNTSEFSQEHIDAVQELQETYSDFLDLTEEMGVSEEFAANADNLKLMEEAANGVEGAYEDLAQAAAEDILIHADVEDIDGAKEALSGLFDYLNSDAFSNLNIGDALDLSGVENQINALADATGWTADQMAAYLNSIGINIDPNMFEPINTALDQADANTAATANHIEGVVEGVADTVVDNLSYSTDTEMTAQTDTQNDQVMYTNLVPHAGMTTTIASTFPVGSANPTAGGAGAIETQTALAHVTGVEYTAQPITESQVKEMTGYGVKSEVKKGAGNGGGGVHLKKGATGSKGSRGVSGAGKSSGGSRPSSSGGRGGGGKGGGGGGGSKAKTIEPKEKKTHQKDYYEEVSGQLDKTEKILSKIEKEEDRLIGDKARANQNKQLELFQKEIDLNKEKQKIQQQELKDIDAEIKEQDRLAESIARTGGVYDSIPDAVFDEDGIVSNYEQISAAIDNIHNKLIDQYNAAAAAGNEDLTKELSKTIEKFDKYGENILKSAQRHDKLQSEIEGTINELEQLQDTIEDIRIDAWKASTEAIDNLKDLRENAAELEGFFSGYESDSPFRDLVIESEKLNNIWSIGKDQAKAYYDEIIADKQKALKLTTDKAEQAAIKNSIDYFKTLRDNLSSQGLNNGLLGLAYQDMIQLKEWYDNPSAKDNVFGNNTAELKEAYEEAYDRVREMLLDYEKEIDNYRDSIIDAYDEIEDKQDRQIDKFDRVVDKLETFSDMYSLYYGDESYSVVRDILQQQGNTLREQLNAQKEIYSYWSEAYAQAIKTGDEKLIQELEDKMHDAEDRMTELAKDAAEAFADSYEKAVKASTQYIIQNTVGDRNFDRLDRNWEWDQQYIEKYRDDVEKAYEMDKLRNKYTDLLNQAQGASLQTQDRIRAQMQEQLDLLDGQATVSEYDVKLANAKLEILQKQIALEDAQRNKNRMQLRRDTQGNYRYVYTADQESVRGAQQDLLDSEYDAYELSKNQQISNYDNLINAYQKYLSQREEILNNANLSEAEKLAQNAELYDKFLKFVDAAKEDFSDAAFGTLDILNWLTLNGTEYTTSAAVEMLNNLLDEQGMIKDETGIIWMDNATYLTEEVIPKISNAVAEADEDIKNRLNELQENIVGDNGVFPAIRNGIEGPDGLVNALEDARTSTQSLTVATRDLMEALTGDNGALAEAQAQLQKYQEELDNVKNASAITAQQLRDAQKALDKSQAENLNYRTILDDIAANKRDKNGNLIDNNAKKNGATVNKNWNAKNDAYEIWINGKWGGGKEWWAPYLKDNHTQAQADAVLDLFNRGYGYNWGFDTGGYTGTWNYKEGLDKLKNGKLAVLHQKELVLNKEDTQNILAAVDMVRKIGVGLRNNIANVDSFSGKNLSTFGDTIEQRVEITATFPNATDANDIRQAIMGLADKAYQYSHRNR